MKTLKKIINLGITNDLLYEEKIKTQFTNSCLFVGLISTPTLAIVLSFFLNDYYILNTIGVLYNIICYVLGLYAAHKSNIVASRNFLLLGVTPIIYLYAFVFGIGSGMELFFPIIIVMSYFLDSGQTKFFSYFYIGASTLVMLLFYSGWNFLPVEISNIINPFIFALILIPLAIFILLLLIIYFDKSAAYLKTIESKNLELSQLIKENKDLEHFAYIASHDLNEPIRTIESFIDIIKEEYHDTTNEDLNQYFSFIHEASARMRSMINGILDYTKLGNDKRLELCDMNQTIAALEQDLTQIIKDHQATINTAPLPTIACDPSGIRQVFQNLMANAIKFQRPNTPPHIEISCQEKATHWEFCVTDNGIGIPENKKETIFKMFSKLHRPTEFKGHGIGLAFCKRIIEFHQGNIWVESTPNVGSQFYFTVSKKL
jgi:signal transduction histidine kinase